MKQWIQGTLRSNWDVTEVWTLCMVMFSLFCAVRFLKNPPLAFLLWNIVRGESYI